MHQDYLPEIRTQSGASLKFKLPQDMGGQECWWRNRLHSQVIARAGSKERLPILGLWNAGDKHYVIAFDFDFHGKPPMPLDRIQNLLDWEMPEALVTQSVSGNPRAFVVVKAPAMDADIAYDYAMSRCPEALKPYLDKHGLARLYVNERLYKELGEWLPSAPVTKLEAEDGKPYDVAKAGYRSRILFTRLQENKKAKEFRFFSSDIPLPEWASNWVSAQGEAAPREKLIRILLATWNLTQDKGFQLPTTTLAKQCGCSPKHISQMLTELQRLGLLFCSDSSYTVGRKSKTFHALAQLQAEILAHKASRKRNPSKPLPTLAIKGQFYHDCLRALSLFKTPEGYMAWVNSLSNLERKGRRLAERMLKCEEKKWALAA